MSDYAVGDRVNMRYGAATITEIIPDASGRGREPTYFVHADIGQGWLCPLNELSPLNDDEDAA